MQFRISQTIPSACSSSGQEGNTKEENNGYVVFKSTGQLGNKIRLSGEGVTSTPPQQASGLIFKDDVNDFSSTSDICFMTAILFLSVPSL